MQHRMFELLQQGSTQLGMRLPTKTLEQLLHYQDLLLLWNKAYNLTAIRHPHDMLTRHLLDSLSIVPHLPPGRLLDIGTGGGMPGLIVALVEPQRPCVLLDSNGKKIRFLRQVCAEMQLPNVTPVQMRIEDPLALQQLGYFEVITSRAFAALTDFVRAGEPYLAEGGWFAAMKGTCPTDELAALSAYRQQVIALQVPNLNEQRHVVMLARQ